jgi:hypothetical protein
MKKVLAWWDHYWFRPAPLLDLAMMRILAVAGQLILYFFVWNPIDNDFVKLAEIPHMYEPLAAVRFFMRPFGVDNMPSLLSMVIIFWATVLAGLLATVGLWTNIAVFLFACGTLFMQAYSYSFGDFHHPEAIMAIMLFVLAFSPCGRVLSVDSRRRGAAGSLADSQSSFAAWPRKVLLCLFSLIYLSAAYYKWITGGWAWLNGYTLQFYLLQDGLRWNAELGPWLAGHHGLAVIMSWVCVLFEAGFFLVLFFPRLLWVALPLGFGMHVGIKLLMNASFWEYQIFYLALIPWAAALHWYQLRRPRLQRP